MFLTDEVLQEIQQLKKKNKQSFIKENLIAIVQDISTDINLLDNFRDIGITEIVYMLSYTDKYSWNTVEYLFKHYRNTYMHEIISMSAKLINVYKKSTNKELNEFLLDNLKVFLRDLNCYYVTIENFLRLFINELTPEHLLIIIKKYDAQVEKFCNEYDFNYDGLVLMSKMIGENYG